MITYKGTIEEIIFTNEINGFTVCEIKCDEDDIVAVGFMPFINVGEILKVTGKMVNHPDYGEQLKVEMYEKMLPETIEAIERYLGSGLIKGVGPATAKKIVNKFGEDTLNVIQFNPERLSHVKGINLQKALRIGETFEEQKDLKDVVIFLQEYGISPTFSAKIYKLFGSETIEKIRSNPYVLAEEIYGITFKTSDRIAKSIGIDPCSEHRIVSGIKYVLSQAAIGGHTFVQSDKLTEYTSHLLDVDISNIDDMLISLAMDKSVYVEKCEDCNRVYLNSFYNAELSTCGKLFDLSMVEFKGDLSDFDEKIESVQLKEGIELADKQKEAVREALINGVLVITGGPGTGKTTIIKTIINLLDSEGYEFALAAPTGRAAKRMTEATGYEAKTIHRLLEIGYAGDEDELVFMKTEANPIEADVVIIDEMSMVDILLMNNLLKAVACGTRLILVGDVDQLPSVGPGNVLCDIIKSEVIKTVKLTEVFRQAQESMIVVNAHRINRGEEAILNNKDKDFFLVSRNSPMEIVKAVIELSSTRIPKCYGFEPMRDIQVLTPMRKGMAGVSNLNKELQKILNSPGKHKREKLFREYLFREGDRVMQIKNNYNLKWEKKDDPLQEGTGVFNGDTGIILKIDSEEQKVVVCFEDERIVHYDFTVLDELEPAFAVTVHKSQGSEFPVVIMPVFSGPQVLMTRNLLYTAVTRARNLVILVGCKKILQQMIQNDRETSRNSDLAGKLLNCIKR
ncbi:ATP-dependent RecD-like DNA helicase [Herbivorax sp. ANBcel31]|uniref:SF1B family DNA helicase RecD2 n=1 Tax=Herbivorax sp. ANBcel31 TaxID=3069754 RepID=UPI0027B86EC1|nr:ATP-dependent RecD-like DNA helicase [Herbivorax sp. ANBcel31]MDQ2085110.1 ATP-dependent RecD-like DNA helicase [Herbivorax sp. ANBcel31]